MCVFVCVCSFRAASHFFSHCPIVTLNFCRWCNTWRSTSERCLRCDAPRPGEDLMGPLRVWMCMFLFRVRFPCLRPPILMRHARVCFCWPPIGLLKSQGTGCCGNLWPRGLDLYRILRSALKTINEPHIIMQLATPQNHAWIWLAAPCSAPQDSRV